MFHGRTKESRRVYKTKHHLEEMVALLGPFPSRLLAQGQVVVAEYFDEKGSLRDPVPRPNVTLNDYLESLSGDEKEKFLMLFKKHDEDWP